MRRAGFEPARPKAPVSKTGKSTNSIIDAKRGRVKREYKALDNHPYSPKDFDHSDRVTINVVSIISFVRGYAIPPREGPSDHNNVLSPRQAVYSEGVEPSILSA